MLAEPSVAGMQVPEGRFYGPCSGGDLRLAFKLFGDTVDRFTFCDLAYRGQRVTASGAVPGNWKLVSRVCSPDQAAAEKLTRYSGNRPLRPWMTMETWRRPDGSEALVELRRDLAQDVLVDQFAPGSIAAFMHVNDSPGEGGSDLWFLAPSGEAATEVDRKLELLTETVSRLCSGGIVVTDGVLAAPEFRSDASFDLASKRWELVCRFANDRHPDWPLRVWRCFNSA